ncbi:MAG: zinc-dependent alcohol dehydrogenase, partial [Anaerotignaceae bacterium]
MKALVMSKPGQVALTEIPTPVPKNDEVLMRIRASGICVNDVRDYKGECSYSYPRIGGHEFAGEIVEMGCDVNTQRFHVGQKVVSYVIENCNQCYFCKTGDTNICPDFANTKCYQNPDGISGFGGFAQYITVKATELYACEDHVPYEILALTEPIACVLNSLEQCNIEMGDDVLVLGGGTMGQLHVMLAHKRGARVILSEPMQKRREVAHKLGADITIDPINTDVVKTIKELTGGVGVKAVFNTTPIPSLALQAIDCTAMHGTVVMFSSLHPNEPVPVN